MNWERGLFRTWIVGSSIWAVTWFCLMDPMCVFANNYRCRQHQPLGDGEGWATIFLLFGVPLIVLALGHVLSWALRGFKR